MCANVQNRLRSNALRRRWKGVADKTIGPQKVSVPIMRRWTLKSGFSSDDVPAGAAPPTFPEAVGREEFAHSGIGEGCSLVEYRGITHCRVRNEVAITAEQPFLMVRMLTSGAGEFVFKGVGATTESPDNFSLYMHGNPEDPCISEHAADMRVDVAAVMLTADRLRAMCEGMRLPGALEDLVAGRNRNSMATLGMSAAKRRLFAELGSSPYSGDLTRLYREGKVLELVAAILANLSGMDTASPRASRRGRAGVETVCDRLLADLVSLPSQEDLARDVGLSPHQLSEAFRDITGMTMPQWILQRKMAMAAELLLEGTLAVKEVSHRLGYAHVSTFTTAFSRHYGCPPASYRNSLVSRHFLPGPDHDMPCNLRLAEFRGEGGH